jgi:hypothetical protein
MNEKNETSFYILGYLLEAGIKILEAGMKIW